MWYALAQRQKGKTVPPAVRDGRGLGRASWLAGARHSAPPRPTSLGTFLFGDKKVPLRRNRTEIPNEETSMAICPLSQKSEIFASPLYTRGPY